MILSLGTGMRRTWGGLGDLPFFGRWLVSPEDALCLKSSRKSPAAPMPLGIASTLLQHCCCFYVL